MAVLECPDCGGSVSDTAPSCVHCGRPMSPREPETVPFPFFPVSTVKFITLSLCTFGFYELYWYYKNWQRIRERSGESLSPFWRAFFAALWSFQLFGRVRDYEANAGRPGWSAGILGTAYFALLATWRLPDPWWLLSVVSFVPILPVLATTQGINRQAEATENSNEKFSITNIIALVVGGLLLLLLVLDFLFPVVE